MIKSKSFFYKIFFLAKHGVKLKKIFELVNAKNVNNSYMQLLVVFHRLICLNLQHEIF